MPASIKDERSRRKREGGNNQKDKLLRRGKAISGAPIMSGASQLPKPPIIVGMTKKKNYNESMRSNNSIIQLIVTEKGAS